MWVMSVFFVRFSGSLEAFLFWFLRSDLSNTLTINLLMRWKNVTWFIYGGFMVFIICHSSIYLFTIIWWNTVYRNVVMSKCCGFYIRGPFWFSSWKQINSYHLDNIPFLFLRTHTKCLDNLHQQSNVWFLVLPFVRQQEGFLYCLWHLIVAYGLLPFPSVWYSQLQKMVAVLFNVYAGYSWMHLFDSKPWHG